MVSPVFFVSLHHSPKGSHKLNYTIVQRHVNGERTQIVMSIWLSPRLVLCVFIHLTEEHIFWDHIPYNKTHQKHTHTQVVFPSCFGNITPLIRSLFAPQLHIFWCFLLWCSFRFQSKSFVWFVRFFFTPSVSNAEYLVVCPHLGRVGLPSPTS